MMTPGKDPNVHESSCGCCAASQEPFSVTALSVNPKHNTGLLHGRQSCCRLCTAERVPCRRRERQSGGFRTLWQGLWRNGGEAAAPASVTVAPPVAVRRRSASGGRAAANARRQLFPDPAHLVRALAQCLAAAITPSWCPMVLLLHCRCNRKLSVCRICHNPAYLGGEPLLIQQQSFVILHARAVCA